MAVAYSQPLSASLEQLPPLSDAALSLGGTGRLGSPKGSPKPPGTAGSMQSDVAPQVMAEIGALRAEIAGECGRACLARGAVGTVPLAVQAPAGHLKCDPCMCYGSGRPWFVGEVWVTCLLYKAWWRTDRDQSLGSAHAQTRIHIFTSVPKFLPCIKKSITYSIMSFSSAAVGAVCFQYSALPTLTMATPPVSPLSRRGERIGIHEGG